MKFEKTLIILLIYTNDKTLKSNQNINHNTLSHLTISTNSGMYTWWCKGIAERKEIEKSEGNSLVELFSTISPIRCSVNYSELQLPGQ